MTTTSGAGSSSSGELGFHYIAVERALLVEQGRRGRPETVRAVVAAGQYRSS